MKFINNKVLSSLLFAAIAEAATTTTTTTTTTAVKSATIDGAKKNSSTSVEAITLNVAKKNTSAKLTTTSVVPTLVAKETEEAKTCWSETKGYKCCKSCDVVTVDRFGSWGVENGEWCGIDY
ncbi:hypothetical protein LY90DRAFT_436430, partial [Neocallimastix californiae]